MTSDQLDDLILAHLGGGADDAERGTLDLELAANPEAGRRLAELALQEEMLPDLSTGERVVVANRNPLFLRLAAFAAAILFAALLLAVALRDEPRKSKVAVAPPDRAPDKPTKETIKEASSAQPPAPRKEAPPAVAVEPPKAELPAPTPKPDPAPVARDPAPREEPKAAPGPEPPVKSAPEPVVFKPIAVASVNGALWRRRDGKVEALRAAAELARADQVFTTGRRAASATLGNGCALWLEKNSTLSVEQRADGTARVMLSGGVAFFSVEPRPAPLAIVTPEGEALVSGASFQVERDEKRCVVMVLDGAVRFRNEKGDVTVKAGQRSAARVGERLSAPAKADVEAAAAWRLRPELSETRAPYADHESGGSRKLPGLVLAAPFFEGEAESGRLAKATSEVMDVGLALGHRFRDLERRTWINVDRGMEADVRVDGSLGPEAFTERARKSTAEYLDQARQASGTAARQPVPMIVQFRNHYLTQGGAELDVCEVAFAGWDRKTIAGLKALYAQLLEKHKPAYRMEMRFQGVDDSYDYKGTRRAFSFAEADASDEGYIAPRNARCATAFFVPPGFGKRDDDYDSYAKIFAELIEYLYQRRR